MRLGMGSQVQGFDSAGDRKSTRLNSSHLGISYAVFCLKKKNKMQRVLVNAPVTADREYEHEVRKLEVGRRLRLALEPLALLRVERSRERQYHNHHVTDN